MANLAELLRQQEGLTLSQDGTTFCGTRGGYTFLYVAVQKKLIVSVIRGTALPSEGEMKPYAKSRPELSGAKVSGTRITFTLRGGSAKKVAADLHTLLPDVLNFLYSNGYRNCCEMTRAEGATVGCMAGGSERLVSEGQYSALVSGAQQNQRTVDESQENIGRGLLYALVGGLIGAIVIVIFERLGRVAALSGVILGYCTINGYRKGAGKISVVGYGLCVLVMLAAVYLGDRVDTAILAVQELGITFAEGFRRMHELVDPDSYKANLLQLYLFTAIGAVPAALNAHRAFRQTNIVYRIG